MLGSNWRICFEATRVIKRCIMTHSRVEQAMFLKVKWLLYYSKYRPRLLLRGVLLPLGLDMIKCEINSRMNHIKFSSISIRVALSVGALCLRGMERRTFEQWLCKISMCGIIHNVDCRIRTCWTFPLMYREISFWTKVLISFSLIQSDHQDSL